MHGGQIEVHPGVLCQQVLRTRASFPKMPEADVQAVARTILAIRVTKVELVGRARNVAVEDWIKDREAELEAMVAPYGG